jgi:pantoate--beta-alanine ligase
VAGINVIDSVPEMQQRSQGLRRQGKTIALVPTMGYLHEGHLSLVRIGRERADDLVVSIFVNPTQFGPGEDLEAYPRDIERDLSLLRREGVDAVFTPDDDTVYGPNFQTYVKLNRLPNHLCGLSRPVHFQGVATVVCKLFNMVLPHTAVFGEKDFQQLVVIRQMAADLNFDIDIVGGPIVREPDGLAMSSRNTYLSDADRRAAGIMYKALVNARDQVAGGVRDAQTLIAAAEQMIGLWPEARVDYISIVSPDTLDAVERIDQPARMALALNIGRTRLIDNMALWPQ